MWTMTSSSSAPGPRASPAPTQSQWRAAPQPRATRASLLALVCSLLSERTTVAPVREGTARDARPAPAFAERGIVPRGRPARRHQREGARGFATGTEKHTTLCDVAPPAEEREHTYVIRPKQPPHVLPPLTGLQVHRNPPADTRGATDRRIRNIREADTPFFISHFLTVRWRALTPSSLADPAPRRRHGYPPARHHGLARLPLHRRHRALAPPPLAAPWGGPGLPLRRRPAPPGHGGVP